MYSAKKIWNITSQEQIIERYLTLLLQIDLLTQSILNRLDKKISLCKVELKKRLS